jgi:hypothetical protein
MHDPYGNALPAGTEAPMAWFGTPLLAMDATQAWRYDASGVDRGTAWTNASYNDSGWSNGFPVFDAAAPAACRGALPANGALIRTCLTLSNAQNTAQLPAVYFRTRFQFEGDAAHAVLRLRTLVDDGAIFYLNGAELARRGLPYGPVSYQTPADRTVAEAAYEDLQISAPGLVEGTNVLAVEVHQDSLTSPDLTFGLSLVGVVPALVAHPRLEIARSGGNFNLTWTPALGVLQAADNLAGPWTDLAPSNPPNQHTAPLNTGPQQFFRVTVR